MDERRSISATRLCNLKPVQVLISDRHGDGCPGDPELRRFPGLLDPLDQGDWQLSFHPSAGQEKRNCAKTGLTLAPQQPQQMPTAHVPASTVGTEEAATPRPSVCTAFDSSSQPTLTCGPSAVLAEFRTEGTSDATVVVLFPSSRAFLMFILWHKSST